MKKSRSTFLLVIIFIFTFSLNVSAMDIVGTYGDMTPSNSITSNLIAYAASFDTFRDADYVVFHDEQYSYYIVWGEDLSFDGTEVTGSDIEYIHYYRTDSSSYNATYEYDHGNDSAFSLIGSHVNTSSLDEYGFSSSLHNEMILFDTVTIFLIMLGSFLFVIMICALRGNK